MKRKPTKPTNLPPALKVGTYQLGIRWVELWLNPKRAGGEFSFLPGKPGDDRREHSKIEIGLDKRDPLWVTAGVLMHEVLEGACVDLQLRLKPSNRLCGEASDTYCFHFDHNQFTELAARTGSFFCDCWPDFVRASARMKRQMPSSS